MRLDAFGIRALVIAGAPFGETHQFIVLNSYIILIITCCYSAAAILLSC
jgi:hypothetical protein